MYISHIKIINFRNFHEFDMSFHDGLNVIVGANNAGKTGLLKAIYLLSLYQMPPAPRIPFSAADMH